MTSETQSLSITSIGARGDGSASFGGRTIHAAYSLPGEVVTAIVKDDRAQIVSVDQASADRVTPPCPHFGLCGGCTFQHWADEPQLAWKREQVVHALARRGIETEVAETIAAWGAGRRRASFHARLGDRGIIFGFARARSNQLEPIEACPVLVPALQRALPNLKALCEAFIPKSETITLAVTATDTGLDVDVRGAGRVSRFARKGLERLAEACEAQGIGRLTFEGETAIERRKPVLRIGPSTVDLPAGSFVQATAAGEEALAALVLEHLMGCARVVDLFAGLGTFALRLKANASVRAYEAEAVMVGAMKRAADAFAGGRALEVEARDLFRAPVAPLELKGVDGAVFDPPRAGAETQATQLARSQVKRVAGVSCDPTSFARDAAILIEGGFKLTKVIPVDQFRWNPHTELVGLFSR
jgi:23S rRNA (uracil1939-C5)-methyltransferase